MQRIAGLLLGLGWFLCGSPGETTEWRLVPQDSVISFVSVKNATIFEAHGFARMSGKVDAQGLAELLIELDSVSTGIDIRDTRMREMLFETKRYPVARFTATVDPALLARPSAQRVPLDGILSLHGIEARMSVDVKIEPLPAGRILVYTNGPVMVRMHGFGLMEGLERLRSVVGLQSIGSMVPVHAVLVFAPAAR